MEETTRRIKVTIARGEPGAQGRQDTYEVPVSPGTSVLNVLDYIAQHLDPSISYQCSCRRSICSVCVMKVNGKAGKSCVEIVSGEELLLEPSNRRNLVKDLVIRM